MDDFFGSLGGLPWYQLRCMRFIADAAAQRAADATTGGASVSGATASSSAAGGSIAVADATDSAPCRGTGGVGTSEGCTALHMPCGVDLQHDVEAARRAAAQGLQALPYMAEIYPIGGEQHVECNQGVSV